MLPFANYDDVRKIETDHPWPDAASAQSIYALLSDVAARHPARPAVTFQLFSDPDAKAETLDWQSLKEQVTQLANLFARLGIGPEDAVAFVLPNSTETVLTLLAGMVAGVVVPINPLLEPQQIASILRETEAKLVVTLAPFPKTDLAQKTAAAVAMAPSVETVLEVDLLRYLTGVKRLIVPLMRPKVKVTHQARVLSLRAEMAREPADVLHNPDQARDRVAACFHTGGTTGMPKVAQHSYSGMIYNGWVGHSLLFTETDTVLCPLPLFHVFASHVILMGGLCSGAHTVFPTPQGYRGAGVFDNFWKLVERWQVTFLITVPTALAVLMQRPVNADISSVKTAFSGSAPLPLELFRRFEAATGVSLVEGYGLTEATCLVSCNPVEGVKKVGSVGIPFPHCDVIILKDTPAGPAQCATDEIGEICVASPGVTAQGIYKDAAKSAAQIYQGRYLRTGDLGRFDGDGYLWITGRAKDLINRGGHNIDPAIIEEALATHPAVAMAAAIGQPDPIAGELPCAYVELINGAEVTAAALMDHARAHVTERAAAPKYVEILPELPKTAVGKTFKPDLRKRAITRVLDHYLAEAGFVARVVAVREDPKFGLMAHIYGADVAEQDTLGTIMDQFTVPWIWGR
ncbi:acyl-CoA synthetase [Rhodobacteraceae bacterium XHP0102]|nr:acyl-CoA synthetase [Rhodobacteraceae bacterium XHP0102]